MPDSTPHTRGARTHAADVFAALLRSDSTDLEPVAADLARAGQDVTRPHGVLLLADLGGGTTAAQKAAALLCTAVYGAVRCPAQPACPAHVAVVVPMLAPSMWTTALRRARELVTVHGLVAVAVAPATGLELVRLHCRRALADLAVAVTALEQPQLVDDPTELVVWRMLAGLDDDGQRAALAPLAAVLTLPQGQRTALLRTADAVLVRGATREDAARRLHVHPNTVRYRLDRLQELTDLSLHDVPTAVRVHLALRLLRLRTNDAPTPASAR